jgi:hypothetical protein
MLSVCIRGEPAIHAQVCSCLQLSSSTTSCKCTTTGTWSGGTRLCSSVRYPVSSGNTSLSRLGSRTPSSTYNRLQRAVSCYCSTQFSANITSSIILFIRRQLVRSFRHRQYSWSHAPMWMSRILCSIFVLKQTAVGYVTLRHSLQLETV